MTNLIHTCFILQYVYYNPLHVSSIICSSSGGSVVLMQHLVSSLSVSGGPVHRTATDWQGKCGRWVRLTTLPPSCAVVMKSGNLDFLEPSGPLQACNGTAFTNKQSGLFPSVLPDQSDFPTSDTCPTNTIMFVAFDYALKRYKHVRGVHVDGLVSK